MQRWQGAALAVVLCAGCLDPMVSDDPGYSRYVQAPATTIPSAYADLQINRKIDNNDGVAAPAIAVKNGFAAGQPVKYWDFGASKRASNAVYGLATCNGDTKTPTSHPPIVDNIPGDSDYSQFRSQYWACVTPKYKGELIPSIDALYDAIDLGLVSDPTGITPTSWLNMPIVASNVGLAFSNGSVQPASPMYYRGMTVLHHSLLSQEGVFPYMDKSVPSPNVYELVKAGQTAVVRVIFSQPYWAANSDPEAPPARNPAYSPNWLVVTVTLREPTAKETCTLPDPEMLFQESDLVTVGMNNKLTAKPCMDATATTNRVDRPFVINDMEVAQ